MRTLLLILAITVYAFSYCPDFKENSPRCLRDTTVNLPTYSDGSYMKKGQKACRDGNYEEKDTLLLQGIPVSVKYRTNTCRTILGFMPLEKLDFDCCSYYADTERSKAIQAALRPVSNPPSNKLKDVYSDAYRKCIDYKVSSCIRTEGYITGYSEDYTSSYDYSDKILTVKESPNAFVDGDTIEMFRDNGTLRYRGYLNIKNDFLVTKGNCYNKSGTAKTRMTNNASLCK